ncbi:hypothetical protein V501_07399 [Pseudogymnoascus sp. VKM F-4519 (FW-2642)]|nr:hypothetical protein V501_07399 [Pseudogymnoascus sp. VKM F-4519 (FW-2642)]
MTVLEPRIWQPLQVGKAALSHRIAMAPMTRYRNADDHTPLDMMTQYYADRACVPGTLIVTEATGVDAGAEGEPNLPGISNAVEMAGWKKIYDAIHAKRSFVFQQLWDLGRGSDPEYLAKRGHKYISSGDLLLKGSSVKPSAMTEKEILDKIDQFRQASRRVVDSGGDGVEIHGAHGYLIDQFTRDSCNNRTDRWGGSVENRSRFLLEVIKAVVGEIGANRVGLRLSPFGTYQDCYSSDTWEQSSHVLESIRKQGHKLAYLSFVEPRFDPSLYGRTPPPGHPDPFGNRKQSTLTFLEQWQNMSPVMVAGGYSAETAVQALEDTYKNYNVMIAFGRPYVANPDLVFRIKHLIPFNPYNRGMFFTPKQHEGYNDYTFSKEAIAAGLAEPRVEW